MAKKEIEFICIEVRPGLYEMFPSSLFTKLEKGKQKQKKQRINKAGDIKPGMIVVYLGHKRTEDLVFNSFRERADNLLSKSARYKVFPNKTPDKILVSPV